tara:strand:+ start:60 stop:413 length:354 start_codon:yes stop_codon:yes gene_type:complete
MTPVKANTINAFTLITIGLWGYMEVQSPTALIPVVFGILLLVCSIILNKKPELTKLIAHIAVLLTLLILCALAGVRLPKSLATGGSGLIRVVIMISTSTLALVYFIKNFIDNKKQKT